MTISATNQGLRPGVCLSTSRPSTPFDGQVIYETDTNRVLVWDNSAWVMIADTDSPPGLQLIKTQTIGSAVSTVTVSDVFTSEFDSYKVIISGGVASANGALRLQVGSATTGYYGGFTAQTENSGYGGLAINNQASCLYAGYHDTGILVMNADIMNPNLSKKTFISALGVKSGAAFGMTFCEEGSTTQHTSFTVSPASGTMTGGTIRVYGYRNS
jgi:hypothetical protein